ncbi:hypothetical protein BGZ99_000933 [Dissophora globulifera]|uniref:GRAM domain-containing protein n=1 Tax=Dissophora globulifera TaxID=979702 RepID=A0A9P6RPE6_9FUNG|nr:hypothetical protein BGZ99_000933 [Dissophora globulifera]
MSASGLTATTAQTAHSGVSVPSKEEVSFQFDRHVQEIRRRRTTPKRGPPPERNDFTKVEADTGKRVLDVPLYVQAHLTYFIESLARDDKVRQLKPLHWSKIRALLSRLYDTSTPAQSLGLYIDRIMYWRSPPETLAWFTLYFTLWFYKLWLPGFISLFILKIMNNRYGFIGDVHETLNVPESINENLPQPERKRSTRIHSQLHDLIRSKDLTDWISQLTKTWGPYFQALLEENIFYLERLKNLFRWERPAQTWRVIALLSFYIFVSTFFQYMVVPAVGLFLGVEFFILLPLQEFYPRFSHVFSPLEWILWNVPTNAELAVEQLSQLQENEPELSESVDPVPQAEEDERESASFVGLTPASKIKYEYQKRMGGSPSSSPVLSSATSSQFTEEKSEFHCMFRGKPGRLLITEDALQFRSAKLLGRDITAEITWENIDTIRKSKTINLGVWSMPGIDVTDINGQVMVFQNVVHRDEAFRKLVMTSGKKWSHVA